MAFRTLQLSVVFAISLWTGSCTASTSASRVGVPGGGGGGGSSAAGGVLSSGGGAPVGGSIPAIPLSLLVSDPGDVTVARGQNATLRCPIAANSTGAPINVTWWHDGRLVENDSRRQIQEDGSLHIRKVAGKRVVSVEGSYSCNVTNEFGSIRTNSARLRIAMLARDFTRQPQDVKVHQSQPTHLECQIQSNPSALVSWERDRMPLPQNLNYVKLPSGDLLILLTQPSDAGSYRCKALNKVSKKHRYSNEAQVSVLPPIMEAQPPKFLVLSRELNYTTVHVGTDLSLFCAATGYPRPNIRWIDNSNAVVGNSSILLLRNITSAHSGNYTCTAFSPAGQIKQTYNVTVVQPPHFITTPISQWFPNSMTVRLDCMAEGIPPPRIRWLKDGQPLQFTARIKLNTPTPQKPVWALVFSHTFSYDQGLYQCVAENPYGRVWSAVQLSCPSCFQRQQPKKPPRPQLPPAPQNVRCRSFNNSSICLQWEMPRGVVNFRAFSAHSYNPDVGKEYVTNGTYFLAKKLDPHTNYTFYVRLYTTISVSDQSDNVTCETALRGSRNLKMNALNNTTLQVEWTTISSDTSCGGVAEYKLQWRRYRHASNNAKVVVNENSYTLTDLLPSQKYEIRVQSPNTEEEELPWMEFMMPNNHNNTNSSLDVPKTVLAPVILEAEPLSPHKIRLAWKDPRHPNDINDDGYYLICYRETRSLKNCENEKYLTSKSTTVEIENLNSYTQYEFKVRVHNFDGSYGPYSHSVECKTNEDVPNPVTGLLAKVLNGSVCVRWRVPTANGQLLRYIISYSDRNDTIDRWPNITLSAKKVLDESCLQPSSDSVSIRLPLDAGKRYKVVVRAATKIGLGKASQIEINTNKLISSKTTPASTDKPLGNIDDMYRNQKLGIIVGSCISLMLIVACISCMIFRRRCLKARALERARMYAPRSTNGQGLTIAVSTPGAVRTTCSPLPADDRQCVAEAHELQCLVETIPPVAQEHIDTKGGVSFPNGQANGMKYIANGHVPNGHVHITENPQFEQFECNGHYHPSSESHQLLTPRNPVDDSLLEDTFNSTQMTNLEESLPIAAPRTHTPILGPNG